MSHSEKAPHSGPGATEIYMPYLLFLELQSLWILPSGNVRVKCSFSPKVVHD